MSLLSHVAKLTISVLSHSHIAFKQHAKGGFFGGDEPKDWKYKL